MKVDIIVIGGGHAGIEAAHIAARSGCTVLMITSHIDLIGHMSCNPAIGGIAKGNIVREIDSLGGLMAKIIDKAGIHFRMLNHSKGMAVWGPRAQADKQQYRHWTRTFLEETPNLFFLQGMVKRVQTEAGHTTGVLMDSGESISASAVILTAGTFLNGTIHIGLTSFPGGRTGEPPSTDLTESIVEYGIKAGRLKTGTSPRIDGRTVDLEKMMPQQGDENPWPFSFSSSDGVANKVRCWESKTNQKTHDTIRESLDRSPLYTGKVHSIGPRYCPSIEDKVMRFGDRGGHTLFLEPEGLHTHEMYLNGLSTSLPFDVQQRMVQSIPGMEKARILRPGYAIEYDYFQPLQINRTLESKILSGLFFAGQINGTSGYEEAACQGLIAGINASERVKGSQDWLILGRETSYTAVLIDDLATKGTEEPYRMFTSRAEHRLLLRQDNADERLMPIAFARGLLSTRIYEERQRIWDEKKRVIKQLNETSVSPETWSKIQPAQEIRQSVHALELLKRPEVSIGDIERAIGIGISNPYLRMGIEADIKYSGFIERENEDVLRMQAMEKAILPDSIEYDSVVGLLAESRIKLKKVRPRCLGQASRIPGITPADVTVLWIHINR